MVWQLTILTPHETERVGIKKSYMLKSIYDTDKPKRKF